MEVRSWAKRSGRTSTGSETSSYNSSSSSVTLDSLQLSSQIQSALFARTQEDVVAAIVVQPTASGKSPLILAISVIRTKSGYRDPKLHQIKIKGANSWSIKVTKTFKQLERIAAIDSTFMTTVDTDGKKVEYSVGDDAAIRNEFMWWIINIHRLYIKTEIPHNVDYNVLSAILQTWSRILVGTSDSSDRLAAYSFSPAQRYIILAVTEDNRLRAEASAQVVQSQTDSDVIILPPISQEEADDVTHFMTQGNLSIATISKLEMYLNSRLLLLQQETVESIFEVQSSSNTGAMSSLLDQVLEYLDEMDQSVSMHDMSLSKMGAGIEKIEAQSEVLDIEDRNHDYLKYTLMWLLTEIVLPDWAFQSLKTPNFTPKNLPKLCDSVLRLDNLIRGNRIPNIESGGGPGVVKPILEDKLNSAYNNVNSPNDKTSLRNHRINHLQQSSRHSNVVVVSQDTLTVSRMDLKARAIQVLSKYQQGVMDLQPLASVVAVWQQRKEYRILASSFVRLATEKIMAVIDQRCKQALTEGITDDDRDLVASGDTQTVMFTKLKVKLSVDKFEAIHSELMQYNLLVGCCERLQPGAAKKLGDYYANALKKAYQHDIEVFFKKIQKVIVGSNIDCKLRNCPEVPIAELASISQSFVSSGMIKSLNFVAPAGKMFVVDAYKYCLERAIEICRNEQDFLLNMFIVWQSVDMSVLSTRTKKHPLVELAKELNIKGFEDESFLKGSLEIDQLIDNTFDRALLVDTSHKDRETSLIGLRNLQKPQADQLGRLMSTLLSPLQISLSQLTVIADKLDHFSTISMLVLSERGIQEGTPNTTLRQLESMKLQAIAKQREEEGERLRQEIASASADNAQIKALEEAKIDLDMFLTEEKPSATPPTQTDLISTFKRGSIFFCDEDIQELVGIDYVITILAYTMTTLKLSWNAFVDQEIKWIEDLNINAKQGGVLSPMAKFPAFIEKLEAICKPIRSEAADMAYTKISVALLKWLDLMASKNTKYQNVILMENAHYFCYAIGSRKPRITSLEFCLLKARHIYYFNRSKYVLWSIAYAMPQLTDFWQRLLEELRVHFKHPTEVSLLQGLTKENLRTLLANHYNMKVLEEYGRAVYKRLQRHLPLNKMLVREVFLLIREQFLSSCLLFVQAVELCYSHEQIKVTLNDINHIYDSIMPLIDVESSITRSTVSREDSISRSESRTDIVIGGTKTIDTTTANTVLELFNNKRPKKIVQPEPEPEPEEEEEEEVVVEKIIVKKPPPPKPKKETIVLDLPPELSDDESTEESSEDSEEERRRRNKSRSTTTTTTITTINVEETESEEESEEDNDILEFEYEEDEEYALEYEVDDNGTPYTTPRNVQVPHQYMSNAPRLVGVTSKTVPGSKSKDGDKSNQSSKGSSKTSTTTTTMSSSTSSSSSAPGAVSAGEFGFGKSRSSRGADSKTSRRGGDDDDDIGFGSMATSKLKSKSKSNYGDDDDDDAGFGSFSKKTTKSTTKSSSKFDEDSDDNPGFGSFSKKPAKKASKFDDSDDEAGFGSFSKKTTTKKTSKFEDDSDDDAGFGSFKRK